MQALVRVESFEVAFQNLYPRAIRSVQRLLGDRSQAEDIASEALARAFADWPSIEHLPYRDAWVLMPKIWVKRLWARGVQDVSALAWRFEVSQQAMLIRLQVLGLVEPQPRCLNAQRMGSLAVRAAKNSPIRKPVRRVFGSQSKPRAYLRIDRSIVEREEVAVA